MDVEMKPGLKPYQNGFMVLLVSVFCLTACLTHASTPVTGATNEIDTPSLVVGGAKDMSTSSQAAATTGMAATVTPTVMPTLVNCPGSGLLYLEDYAHNEAGQVLDKLYLRCMDDSSTSPQSQLVASDILDYMMAASPRGDRVAFANDVIEVLELPGRERMTFLERVPEEYVTYLSWSPDEEYIVYQRYNRYGDLPLEVIHLSTGTVSKQLIPTEYEEQLSDASITGFVWLPQGDQLLLYGDYTQDLYLADIACDQVSHLCTIHNLSRLPLESNVDEPPAVAPDGKKMATTCLTETHPPQKTLCILDFNGHILDEFTLEELSTKYIYNLAWSLDGFQIAYDDGSAIHILSLDEPGVPGFGNIRGYLPTWIP